MAESSAVLSAVLATLSCGTGPAYTSAEGPYESANYLGACPAGRTDAGECCQQGYKPCGVDCIATIFNCNEEDHQPRSAPARPRLSDAQLCARLGGTWDGAHCSRRPSTTFVYDPHAREDEQLCRVLGGTWANARCERSTGTPAGPPACRPACRSGFTCVDGVCLSACNPPCATDEICTPRGECAARQLPDGGPDAGPPEP